MLNLIEPRRKRRDLTGTDIAERYSDGELCLDFGDGPSRDRDKAAKLGRTEPVAPLGNVGWNRDCGTSELRDEPKLFLSWKRSGHAVNVDDDAHGELPDIQIPVGSDSGRLLHVP